MCRYAPAALLSALLPCCFVGAAAPPEAADVASPSGAVEAALADLLRLPEDARPYARYFWVTTARGEERDGFLVTFCVQLNMLSRAGKLSWPAFVAPDLLRIDVRDYCWDRHGVLTVWEKTAAADVAFHQQAVVETDKVVLDVAWPGGKDGGKRYEQRVYQETFRKGDVVSRPAVWLKEEAAKALRHATYSESPVLPAEWFFGQTARQRSIYNEDEPGIGYYDFLALTDRDEFFKLTGADPKKADELFRTWRAAVLDSGVSEQNRQVFRHGAIGEFVWGTLDTFAAKDKGVLQRNLRDKEFQHDAEEWFGRNGVGLPVMALFDAKGKRQSVAPDKIGADKSALSLKSGSNDLAIHNPLSCIRCHGKSDLLRDVDDWARDTFKQGSPLTLGDPSKPVALELQSQYLRDVNRLLKKDRADYSDAIKEATTSKLNPEGWTCETFAKEYSAAWDRYANRRVTPEIAARELGVSEESLMKGIETFTKARGQGDNVLSTWLVSKRGIKRTVWEQSYALAMSTSLGLRPPEKQVPIKEGKK